MTDAVPLLNHVLNGKETATPMPTVLAAWCVAKTIALEVDTVQLMTAAELLWEDGQMSGTLT